MPRLWLPAQVQGNGNEHLKREPRGEGGGGGLDGWNLSPHNGMSTKISMHVCSPKYSTFPLLNWHFAGFLGDEKGHLLSQTESKPTSRSSSDLARLRRFAERRLEARIPPMPQNLEPWQTEGGDTIKQNKKKETRPSTASHLVLKNAREE